MLHPLLALATAYDLAVPPLSGRPSLKELMDGLLKREPGEAVCYYAAHFAVLTQAYQLGKHGILEEPQTDALYGLLASSFWHGRVLGNTFQKPKKAAQSGHADGSARYWAYQSKPQEAESGFDFGIITPCRDRKVKVTLFQAKRPAKNASPRKLSLRYVVREASGLRLHRDHAEWETAERMVQKKIREAQDSEEISRLPQLLRKKKNLKLEDRTWDHHAGPREQLCALANIRDAFAEGKTVVSVLKRFKGNDKLADNVLQRGDGSLFNKQYAYEQYYAFLATALHGWLLEGPDKPASSSWCYYVQWVNRSAGEPWSVPLEQAFALRRDEQNGATRQRFADVLAASLSSTDRTVGLIVDEDDLNILTGLITSDLPELVWGVVAEHPEIARKLLTQCEVSEEEIVSDISPCDPRADDELDSDNTYAPPSGGGPK